VVFTSLYHHVTDVDNLRACFKALDGGKAVGVDGVTKEQYGENIDERLEDLAARLNYLQQDKAPWQELMFTGMIFEKTLGCRIRQRPWLTCCIPIRHIQREAMYWKPAAESAHKQSLWRETALELS